jgi:hypothetical protein
MEVGQAPKRTVPESRPPSHGHALLRWVGLVAVSDRSEDELERSTTNVEHAGAQARAGDAASLWRAGRRLRLHPAALSGIAVRTWRMRPPQHTSTSPVILVLRKRRRNGV